MVTTRLSRLLSCVLGLALLLGCGVGASTEAPRRKPERRAAAPDLAGRKMEKATFAAGCFWGVEATFRKLKGVEDARVGYTGGHAAEPTYRQVCSGTTGHAEAVEVTYDPKLVTYKELLDVFWRAHDPTTPNRQGPDIGDQYRSAIFYHTPEQKAEALASKERQERSGGRRRPIVTQIVPATAFHPAEEYHQRYIEKRGLKTCGL